MVLPVIYLSAATAPRTLFLRSLNNTWRVLTVIPRFRLVWAKLLKLAVLGRTRKSLLIGRFQASSWNSLLDVIGVGVQPALLGFYNKFTDGAEASGWWSSRVRFGGGNFSL